MSIGPFSIITFMARDNKSPMHYTDAAIQPLRTYLDVECSLAVQS